MNRMQIINSLIATHGFQSYLEVGVSKKRTSDAVKGVARKVGVDPSPRCGATYTMTSDEFFAKTGDTFDLISIEGSHHAEQVYRDVLNSLRILREGGVNV